MASAPPPSARILVVDDDEPFRLLMRRVLVKAGYAVEAAEHGDDALARFGAGSYDLMITDLSMPRMTGLELITSVIGQRPDLRIIALSGAPDRGKHFLSAIGSGAKAILQKPLSPDQLLRAVQRVLAGESVTETRRDQAAGDASIWRDHQPR
jgi:CheY-like chemotaxis protein